MPALWEVAAAAIVAYTAAFVSSTMVSVNDICKLARDAWSRFFLIVFDGFAFLASIAILDIIAPGVVSSIRVALAGEGTLLGLLLYEAADMSLFFLLYKVVLLLWIFYVAYVVFLMTLSGKL